MQHINSSMQLGKVLAARRKALGFSQNEFSARLGLSQNRLSELEASADKLTVERLLAMLNLLGLEMAVRDRTTTKAAKSEW